MKPYVLSSSTHAFGWTAEAVGASPEETTFTSGATEPDNMALLGMLRPGDHFITSATEHGAILETANYLSKAGVNVAILPVDEHGVVFSDPLREAMDSETSLVSIMLANNETGTTNPVGKLADIAHEHGVSFHTDAEPSHVLEAMGIDDETSAAVRFSLGRFTTDEEIERAGEMVVEAYEK